MHNARVKQAPMMAPLVDMMEVVEVVDEVQGVTSEAVVIADDPVGRYVLELGYAYAMAEFVCAAS